MVNDKTCLAWKVTCKNCLKKKHMSKCCRSKNGQGKVNEILKESTEEDECVEEEEFLDNLNVKAVGVAKKEFKQLIVKDVKGVEEMKFCEEFPEAFEESLGCLKGYVHKIKMKKGVKLVVSKVRKVLFEIREAVAKELHTLERRGVIEKVELVEWESHIVIARKQWSYPLMHEP
ncbi:hypothetical protein NDU88_002783 [Pleurodeles waltl]|uniref:Uncharacterized protein n=1 Tax=Pleurodeles waltl TaxID=8319 RepID=A0AAV7W4D0_PLEWA|nr:hypothetical protein NDU88_002783 [Pleurodeles waltl]